MDMDGIGTFALFLSSGAVGMGLILLSAYRMRLKTRLEEKRLESISDSVIDELRHEMRRLNERVDFAERLLEGGRPVQSVKRKESSAT